MTGRGRFVEVQGTAERTPFDARSLQSLLRLGQAALQRVFAIQRKALGVSSIAALIK
jgi:ribonuclease PH